MIFTVLIMYVATAKNHGGLASSKLDYLGRISYGIYMYHRMCIGIAILLAGYLPLQETVSLNVFLYGSSFGLTISIAALSFTYFGKRFLDLKVR